MALKRIKIDHPHNEASALLGVQSLVLLELRGWNLGFWTVSDEKDGPEAIAVLGRTHDGRWDVVQVKTDLDDRSTRKRTADCESLARAGSWIYVVGSQFGSKRGELQPKRHFLARFNEAMVEADGDELRVRLEIARRPFLLHRMINDAIREDGVALRAPGRVARSLIKAARRRGKEEEKSWRDLVKKGDVPINVEGATFLPGGNLLLGLREPVTLAGHPLLVEIEGIDRYFDEKAALPEVIGLRVLRSAGKASAPLGVRELDSYGGDVHVVVGDLDEEAGGDEAAGVSEHWTVPLVEGQRGLLELKGKLVRRFDDEAAVEGMALEGERVWYAHDDEAIRLDVTEERAPR